MLYYQDWDLQIRVQLGKYYPQSVRAAGTDTDCDDFRFRGFAYLSRRLGGLGRRRGTQLEVDGNVRVFGWGSFFLVF